MNILELFNVIKRYLIPLLVGEVELQARIAASVFLVHDKRFVAKLNIV